MLIVQPSSELAQYIRTSLSLPCHCCSQSVTSGRLLGWISDLQRCSCNIKSTTASQLPSSVPGFGLDQSRGLAAGPHHPSATACKVPVSRSSTTSGFWFIRTKTRCHLLSPIMLNQITYLIVGTLLRSPQPTLCRKSSWKADTFGRVTSPATSAELSAAGCYLRLEIRHLITLTA